MSMVVQHNLQAMNSNRMLGITTSSQSKSTEKLSSGYKINRAADDAAGLTISEKMRKQMRGLDRASTNAQDGVSAVQTAEGALTEVHSMLQRMNELAVQSANGTNSQSDRDAIQAEIDQLVTEIDRVSETTKFNEIYLLKGDADAAKTTRYSYISVETPASFEGANGTAFGDFYAEGADATVGAYADEDTLLADLAAGKKIYTDAAVKNQTTATANNEYTITHAAIGGTATTTGTVSDKTITEDLAYTWNNGSGNWVNDNDPSDTISNADLQTKLGITITAPSTNGVTITTTAATVSKNGDIYAEDGTTALTDREIIDAAEDGDTLYSTPVTYTQTEAKAGTDYTYTPATSEMAVLYDEDGKAVAADKIDDILDEGGALYADKNATTEVAKADLKDYTTSTPVNAALEFNLHVGADSADSNKIKVKIDSMSAAGIGVNELKVDTEESATAAIDTIAAAIQQVSSQRSALGAIQNRLEHTIANLDNVVENTTAAESRIRDTDMAEEMVEYSKNNILAQAGQSMLAQANQSTQGVLSLLG